MPSPVFPLPNMLKMPPQLATKAPQQTPSKERPHNHESKKDTTPLPVFKNIGKPTLTMSHNKALTAQLYSEFNHFFPNNNLI